MKTLGQLHLALPGLAILLSPVLLPTLGHADSIDFSNVTSLSVTEGNSTKLAITVTNNLGAPITTDGLLSFSFLPGQGDPTDDPAPFVSFDQNHTCASIKKIGCMLAHAECQNGNPGLTGLRPSE